MVDKKSKQQACQLLIEQEIEAGLADGKSKHALSKEITQWIAKVFNAQIKAESIRRRIMRVEQRGVTDVTPLPADPDGEEPEWQEPPILNQAGHVSGIVRERNLKEIKEKAEQINKKSKEVKKLPKLGPPSIGLQYARMAILDLEQITDDDLERDDAFSMVKNWIFEHE